LVGILPSNDQGTHAFLDSAAQWLVSDRYQSFPPPIKPRRIKEAWFPSKAKPSSLPLKSKRWRL
jgi:hypothetical protein